MSIASDCQKEMTGKIFAQDMVTDPVTGETISRALLAMRTCLRKDPKLSDSHYYCPEVIGDCTIPSGWKPSRVVTPAIPTRPLPPEPMPNPDVKPIVNADAKPPVSKGLLAAGAVAAFLFLGGA